MHWVWWMWSWQGRVGQLPCYRYRYTYLPNKTTGVQTVGGCNRKVSLYSNGIPLYTLVINVFFSYCYWPGGEIVRKGTI